MQLIRYMRWDGKIKNSSILTAVLFTLLTITACGGASGDQDSPFSNSDEPGPEGVDIPVTIAKVELDPHRINVVISEDSISFAGQEEAVSHYLESSFVRILNTITEKQTFVPINSDRSFDERAIVVDDLTDSIKLTVYNSGVEGPAIYLEAEDLNTFSWFDEDGELIFRVEEDGSPEGDESKIIKTMTKPESKTKFESEELTCDIDEKDVILMVDEAGLGANDDYKILESNCEYVVQVGSIFYYVDQEGYKLAKVLDVGYEKILKVNLNKDGSLLGVRTDKYIYIVDLLTGTIKKIKPK